MGSLFKFASIFVLGFVVYREFSNDILWSVQSTSVYLATGLALFVLGSLFSSSDVDSRD